MKKILGLPALLILLSLPVMAQEAPAPAPPPEQEKSAPEPPPEKPANKTPPKKDWGLATPRWDISGGYSFLSYYPPATARINTNGFDGSIDYNLFRRWLAVAADVAGDFKNSGNTLNGSTSVYTFMVGPRIYPFGHAHKIVLYGQALVGGGYVHVSHPAVAGFGAFSESDTAKAYGAGGGIDYRLSQHWEVRAIEGDFVQTYFSVPNGSSTGGPPVSRSNFRISVGITYRLGEKK
jgi:opacity protein-like surface antigen